MTKNFFFSLVVLLFLSIGCVPSDDVSHDNDAQPEMVIVPDDMVACLIDVGKIQYLADAKGTDTWQTPEETVASGKGDCEDICIYFQDLARRKGIEVDVVFGLKTIEHKHGHCWCEYEQGSERFIIEPRTNAFYHRSRLPAVFYIRADDVDVVEEKVREYHSRSGVWVSQAYRKRIEEKQTGKSE